MSRTILKCRPASSLFWVNSEPCIRDKVIKDMCGLEINFTKL